MKVAKKWGAALAGVIALAVGGQAFAASASTHPDLPYGATFWTTLAHEVGVPPTTLENDAVAILRQEKSQHEIGQPKTSKTPRIVAKTPPPNGGAKGPKEPRSVAKSGAPHSGPKGPKEPRNEPKS